MDMTRATFLIAAALAVALVVAAAGTGAYIAVRQNAEPPNAVVEEPAPQAGMAATLHGIEPQVILGEANSAPGVAVASTEQILEPAAATGAPAEPETPRTRRSRSPAPRPVAPPSPAPPPPQPSRAATPAEAGEADRPAPRPVPAAAQPEPEPEVGWAPEPATPPARRPPGRARRALPEVEGWKPADPAPATGRRNRPAGRDAAIRDLPPLASGDLALPVPDAVESLPTVVETLLVPADSVIGLQIDTFVSTDRAAVEDDVQARVTRDVMVARRVAIPAGSLVNGSVVLVERGGKLQGAARLGVRFHTVVLDDGLEVPIATETVYREGRSRGRDNAARIGGGAVAGAILGAIFGGGRGAAIGGAAGAAGGTAAAAAGDAEPATLPAGTTLTVRLARPSSVTIER